MPSILLAMCEEMSERFVDEPRCYVSYCWQCARKRQKGLLMNHVDDFNTVDDV